MRITEVPDGKFPPTGQAADEALRRAKAAMDTQPAPVAAAPAAEAPSPVESLPEVAAPDSIEPAVAASKPAEESPQLSPQYAALARKEKALRQQIREFKVQQDAFKAEQDAAKLRPAPSVDTSKYIERDRVKADPVNTLQELGLSYEELTQSILNQSQQDPYTKAALARMESQLKLQEERIAAQNKALEDQQSQSYTQALNQITAEAKNLVKDGDAFEMIKAVDGVKDVVSLIERTFKEDGHMLSVEEACQLVEEDLVEQIEKLTRTQKIQKRLQPASSKPASQQPEAPKQPEHAQLKTLTNAVGTSKKLSPRERAIAAFKGELKS